MEHPEQRLLRQTHKNQEIAGRRNALSDLIHAAGGTAFIRLWMSVLTFLRRFRMLRIILQIIGWLVTVLQAGTLIVLTTIVFFVLLPILIFLPVTVTFLAMLDRQKSRKRLSAAIADSREVLFVFATGPVIAQTARDLTEKGGRTVLFVSPYWISGQTTNGSPARYYVNLRQESDRVFLIRRYFFFCARKLVRAKQITLVY